MPGAANSPECDPGPKRRDPFGKALILGAISHVTDVIQRPDRERVHRPAQLN